MKTNETCPDSAQVSSGDPKPVWPLIKPPAQLEAVLLVEARSEAAAKEHYQAVLNGAPNVFVRRLARGFFVTTAQPSGRRWRFTALLSML